MPEEEELERKLSFSHWGGRASVYEELHQNFRRRAGEAFSNCRDEDAKMFRRLSDEFKQSGLSCRDQQAKFKEIPDD